MFVRGPDSLLVKHRQAMVYGDGKYFFKTMSRLSKVLRLMGRPM